MRIIESQSGKREILEMIIYCYKKCSTCKKAVKFLENLKVDFKYVDYTENPLTKNQIREYWEKSGLTLKKFFNTSGILYREFDMKNRLPDMTEDEQIEILSENPKLIKRPLLILEDKVEIGFNEQEWKKTLKEEI